MKKFFLFLFALTFVLSGCVKGQFDDKPEQQPEENIPAVVPGAAIVRFTEDMINLIEPDLEMGSVVTKSSALNSVSEHLGIKSMTRVFPHAGEFEARTRAEGLHRWYNVTYDPEISITKAAGDLIGLPGVESVEPVRNIRHTAIFDDPYFNRQWHYYNDGTMSSNHSVGADVNVLPVWESYTTGDPDVIVAVVDEGIDMDHEDLQGAYVGGYNFVTNTTSVVPGPHGTHVAGTIGAINNNGIGVVGLAGGDAKKKKKGVSLLSCQIFQPDPNDPTKTISADGAEAIKWGADNGAVISQNSWGYIYEKEEDQAAAVIPSHLQAAIDYFIKYAGVDANGNQVGPMKGGVVIFAAGNDAREHNPIGKYDEVISVGSISSDFTRAPYSNYGSWVDLAAPGGNSRYAQGDILSTIPGGYAYMQGTSMACPHVSGVAALVVSYFKGQGFTNTTLREKLINGANASVLSKNAKIGRLVDAFGAITYGGTQPPKKVVSATVEPVSNSIHATWKVTSDPDDKKAYGFLLVASKDRDKIASLNPVSIPDGVFTSLVMTGTNTLNSEISGVVSGLEFETEYHFAIIAFDYNRNYSDLSPIYTVTTLRNNPPVINIEEEGVIPVRSHETLNITIEIIEPDGHDIEVEFVAGSKAASLKQLPDGTWQMSVIGNADEPGNYTAKVTVTDSYGLEMTKDIQYEIMPNHAPVIIKQVENMLFYMPGMRFALDMTEYLNDPDGEQLKFSISITDRTVLHINPKDNILNATSLGYGVTDVIIVATDSRGLKCTLTFKVLVKDTSVPMEVYPNPVKDWLNISTLEVASTNIRILSSTGQVVYDETYDVSAFDPALIDMRKFAPGVYRVEVKYDDQAHNRTIVKL